jgi:SAM-dependent methyltransferase
LTLLKGIPSSLPDNAFDVVFFVETIEHVLPDELPQTLSELRRIVRPGGFVVVSTPHDENLNASRSVCPECGACFHKMQHVSSWTSKTIAAAMEQVGWLTVRSKPTLLPENSLVSRWKSFYSNLVGRKQKHLVYVGQKPLSTAGVAPSSSQTRAA